MTRNLVDYGSDGNSGKLNLGFRANLVKAHGIVDYSQMLTRNWGSLSAFASGHAGLTRIGGSWQTDVGIKAGLRVTW